MNSNPTNGKEPGKGMKQRKEKKPVATTKQRKPTKNEKPSRPLSAYNVFFKEERVKWLAESSDNTTNQQKFTQLGYEMGQRWKKLSAAEKLKYEKIAQEDVKRYQKEMEQYEQKASPKKASKTKSPQKSLKESKEKVGKTPAATTPSSVDAMEAARRVVNAPSPATRDPQGLMIQQLLASQQGAPLGQQQQQQIPLQVNEREAILRQLQLQELASRSQLSQHLPGNPLVGYPNNQYLGALSGGGGMLPGLEQQLLIQRLRDQELRSQLASLERGLTAQPFAPLSNLDLLALQASSQPVNHPPSSFSDSELLANMSVREKLQLLMQLNQQGY